MKNQATQQQLSKALADTQRELADLQEQIKFAHQTINNGSIMIADLNNVIKQGERINAELRKKNSLLMEIRPLISNLLANNESVIAAMRKINEASRSENTMNGCQAE